jgi:hypothetical protein
VRHEAAVELEQQVAWAANRDVRRTALAGAAACQGLQADPPQRFQAARRRRLRVLEEVGRYLGFGGRPPSQRERTP